MKKVNLILVALIGVTVFTACNKSNDKPEINRIVGTYNGSVIYQSNDKTVPATASVTGADDYSVNVHCYSDSLDTTFTMSIYQDNDYIYCSNNETGNHGGHGMNMAQHCNSDEHHGEFDMDNGTFNYLFNMETGDINFSGTKRR